MTSNPLNQDRSVSDSADSQSASAGSADSDGEPADMRLDDTARKAENAAWLEKFTIELRLLDVSGGDIGDAVASAREFLTDAGTRAEESFGDAQRYAAELDLPALPRSKNSHVEVLVTSGIGVIGLVVLGQAVFPLAGGNDDLGVKVWMLVSLVAMVILLALVPRIVPVLMRARSRSRVWMILLGIVLGGIGPVVLSVWQGQGVLFTVPALPIAIGAGILLLAPAIWNQVHHTLRDDPIIEPGTDSDQRPSLGTRLFLGATNWILVFYGAVSFVLIFALYPDSP